MIKRVGTLVKHRQPEILRARGDVLQMDDVDRRIIALLSAEARASYAEIGAAVNFREKSRNVGRVILQIAID